MNGIDAFSEGSDNKNNDNDSNGRYITMRFFKTELRAFKWELRFIVVIALVLDKLINPGG